MPTNGEYNLAPVRLPKRIHNRKKSKRDPRRAS
jgi:hypothetical protein